MVLCGMGWMEVDGYFQMVRGADKVQHQSEIHMATSIFWHSCTYYLTITLFPAVARAMHQRVVLACLPDNSLLYCPKCVFLHLAV